MSHAKPNNNLKKILSTFVNTTPGSLQDRVLDPRRQRAREAPQDPDQQLQRHSVGS
jgi:hypothetical protein